MCANNFLHTIGHMLNYNEGNKKVNNNGYSEDMFLNSKFCFKMTPVRTSRDILQNSKVWCINDERHDFVF